MQILLFPEIDMKKRGGLNFTPWYGVETGYRIDGWKGYRAETCTFLK